MHTHPQLVSDHACVCVQDVGQKEFVTEDVEESDLSDFEVNTPVRSHDADAIEGQRSHRCGRSLLGLK